jgi:hypothetical protein
VPLLDFSATTLPACSTNSNVLADNAPSIVLLLALGFCPQRRFVVIGEGRGTSHEIILFGQRNPN